MSRRVMLVVAAIGSIMIASPSSAQGIVGLGRREGTLEFGLSSESGTNTSDGLVDSSIDDRRTDERLALRGDLYLFQPSFANVFYGFGFGFLQDQLSANGKELPAKVRLVDYDFSGDFLTSKKYGVTLFATRAHTVNSREFLGTSETSARNEGATLHLRSFILPGTLSYRREFFEEAAHLSGFFGNNNYETSTFSFDGQHTYGSHDVSAHYTLGDVDDRIRPDFSYSSRTADLRDRYTSGGDLPDTFTSTLHYFERAGRLTIASLFVDEDYRATHSPSLASSYGYVLSRFKTDDSPTTMSHTASASLQHTLYQSLQSGVGLFGTLVDVPDGTSRTWAARGDTNYRKRLRGQSVLIAGINGLYQVSDNRVQGRALNIFQEKHAARFGVPFRLNQQRPIPSTVLVTSESGALFQEGLDFVVRVVGEFAEIQIVPSGRIRDGDTLLVEYRVNVPPAATLSTRGLGARIEPDFGWVSPYYAYERTVQTLMAGDTDSPLEDLTGRTVGVRLRWNGARFSGMALAEYRNQDSRLIPYDGLQLSQFLSYVVRQSFSVTCSLDQAFFHYLHPQRKTSSGTGRLAAGWTPRPAVSIDAFVSARLWSDTLAADETYRDAGVRAQWITPTFTLASTLNRDVRRRNGNVAEQSRVTIEVARRF